MTKNKKDVMRSWKRRLFKGGYRAPTKRYSRSVRCDPMTSASGTLPGWGGLPWVPSR